MSPFWIGFWWIALWLFLLFMIAKVSYRFLGGQDFWRDLMQLFHVVVRIEWKDPNE